MIFPMSDTLFKLFHKSAKALGAPFGPRYPIANSTQLDYCLKLHDGLAFKLLLK
jgi:hypothetical protein